jgi:type IV pilus assembly protein PilM
LAKAVGLDIGSRACKVAVLSGGPKGAKLLRYVEKEYDLGEAGTLTPAAVIATMKLALSEARAPKNSVACAVPAEQCTLREITVPFTDDDQIKKVVKFEFEPHLHSAAIEDVVIDYVRTGSAKGGTRLLVIAAAKEMLRSRLAQLKEVGVDPLHLDVDVAALFNTAKQTRVFDEHPNCLIIDIGARTTKTLLVQDGRLKVARSIRLGAQGPRERLTAEFEGDTGAARRAMEDAAGVEALAQAPGQASTMEIVASVQAIEAAAAGAQQTEFLSRVLRETQRSLPILGEDKPLTRIFVTGLASTRAHARERIADHFGVEVADLPTMTAVTHSLPPSKADEIGKSGAIAIGAGLKVLGIDAGEIDLRREEFRFARTFDAVKVALATFVTMLFFGVFLAVFAKYKELTFVRAERHQLELTMEKELRGPVIDDYEKSVKDARKESEAERARSRDEDQYFVRMRARLRSIQDHLKNELGLATEVPPIRSCLETWMAVMNAAKAERIPPNPAITYLAFRDEHYTQDKADLKVVFGDFPDVDKLVGELRKNDTVFLTVDSDRPQPLKDKGIEVPIKIQLKQKDSGDVEKAPAEKGEPK